MATCKIKEKYHWIECNRSSLEGDPERLCLLHSNKKDKDKKKAFTLMVIEKLEKEDYNFRGVFFPGNINNFVGHGFEKDADFSGATFSGEVSFSGATFSKGAIFSGVTFKEVASFTAATFKKVNFYKAIFNVDADFTEACFEGEAYFIEALFKGRADFTVAYFYKKAKFSKAIIGGQIVLCNINTERKKGGCQPGYTYVSGTQEIHYGGTVRLSDRKKKSQLPWPLEVEFYNLEFQDRGRMHFQDLSLAYAELNGTDLLQCRFNNIDWHPFRGRQALYGEVRLYENKETKAEKPSNEQYARVEECYRYLKLNYEGAGDFKKAGDFHYGEMEMHRRASKWRGVPFYWYNLYRCFSGYGERPLRAFIWLLLLIPAWAGLVWGLGIDPAGSQTPINYGDTLLFIFEKAALQRPPWPAGITWLGKFLSSLSVLLLPGQAALFILALRNRLGRRR